MMMYEFIREVLERQAYWLDPQRRYFPQDMATDYIGLDVQCQELARNLTEGKHRGISFYKITIKALLLAFFNRFKWI
jgi:hypothetical protein